MDQLINLHIEKSQSPSKLVALLALVLAMVLPFLLVKTFPHKQTLPFSTTKHQEIPEIVTALPVEKAEPLNETINSAILKPPLTKLVPIKPLPPKSEWITINIRDRDTLAGVFNRAGLSLQLLQQILKGNPHASLITKLKPNEAVQFQIKDHILEKMILPINPIQYFVITREANRYKTILNTRKMDSKNHFITATINGSLYLSAKKNNIPYKIIRQMTDIFHWDINFAKDIKSGDQFSIIYKTLHIAGKLVGTGDILAVSYRNKGHNYQAVQYLSKNGQAEYYTPEGISLKKAFDRYPLRFSHISSTFSLSRYHPILHYTRAHKGVDLAAPIGTPIRATGSGHIEMIGRNHGYGNMIKIKHDKQFSTVYGHMLKFQKGLSTGSLVHRGDVIGYVGQSGLASGPHCHFEFHIHNQPKNPTTIKLPRGLSIPSKELATFRTNASTILAELNLYEKTRKIG